MTMTDQELQVIYSFAQEFGPLLSWIRENRDSIQLAPTDLSELAGRVKSLEGAPAPVDLSGIEKRLSDLEGVPPVDVPDVEALLAPIVGRLTRLEKRPTPKPVDLSGIKKRLSDLEGVPPVEVPDLSSIEDRLSALENQPAPEPVDLSPLEDRVRRLEELTQALQTQLSELQIPEDCSGVLGQLLEEKKQILVEINRAINTFSPYDDRPILRRLAALEVQ